MHVKGLLTAAKLKGCAPWLYVWMDGWMDEDGCIDGWGIHGWLMVDGYIDGPMDGCDDGWVGVWMSS